MQANALRLTDYDSLRDKINQQKEQGGNPCSKIKRFGIHSGGIRFTSENRRTA